MQLCTWILHLLDHNVVTYRQAEKLAHVSKNQDFLTWEKEHFWSRVEQQDGYYITHKVETFYCIKPWWKQILLLQCGDNHSEPAPNLAHHQQLFSPLNNSYCTLHCFTCLKVLSRIKQREIFTYSVSEVIQRHWWLTITGWNESTTASLSFLSLIPIIFHLITLSEISGGRGNETTCFYGIIHQELIEAFIQFSADKTV